MPAVHTYEIRRTQKVIVRTTDVQKALIVAEAYLDGHSVGTEVGTVAKPVEIVDVYIRQVN